MKQRLLRGDRVRLTNGYIVTVLGFESSRVPRPIYTARFHSWPMWAFRLRLWFLRSVWRPTDRIEMIRVTCPEQRSYSDPAPPSSLLVTSAQIAMVIPE